jgi:hypothetical protein
VDAPDDIPDHLLPFEPLALGVACSLQLEVVQDEHLGGQSQLLGQLADLVVRRLLDVDDLVPGDDAPSHVADRADALDDAAGEEPVRDPDGDGGQQHPSDQHDDDLHAAVVDPFAARGHVGRQPGVDCAESRSRGPRPILGSSHGGGEPVHRPARDQAAEFIELVERRAGRLDRVLGEWMHLAIGLFEQRVCVAREVRAEVGQPRDERVVSGRGVSKDRPLDVAELPLHRARA